MVNYLFCRLEKEYALKLSSVVTQREKAEEGRRREAEKLQSRREDLDQQLDSMMLKFKV